MTEGNCALSPERDGEFGKAYLTIIAGPLVIWWSTPEAAPAITAEPILHLKPLANFGTSMAQIPDASSLQSVLLRDVVRALAVEPRDDSTRRAAIRAVCAAIEGILWALQCELVDIAGPELSTSQRAILRDKPHILREDGKVGRVPSKASLKQRVQFAAAVVATLRPECQIAFDEAGWQNLLSTLDVRDRLGHPENQADLDVTDVEVEAAASGEVWFLDNLVAVIQTDLRRPRADDLSTTSGRGRTPVRRLRPLPMTRGNGKHA